MSGRRLLPVYHLMDNMMMSDRSPHFNSNCVSTVDAITKMHTHTESRKLQLKRCVYADGSAFNVQPCHIVTYCDLWPFECGYQCQFLAHSMLTSTKIYFEHLLLLFALDAYHTHHFQFSVFIFVIFLSNQNEIPSGSLAASSEIIADTDSIWISSDRAE